MNARAARTAQTPIALALVDESAAWLIDQPPGGETIKMRHLPWTDRHAVHRRYFQRVLVKCWPMPTRTRTLLNVGCDGSRMATELARLGFRVTVVDLTTLTCHERIFDVVCWSGRLEHLDTWNAGVGMVARLLPSGGVFLFGATVPAKWSPLCVRMQPITQEELLVTLQREGFCPQEIVPLSKGVVGSAPCMGYAVRGRDAREPRASGRWRFLASEQRWAFVPGDCRFIAPPGLEPGLS